MKYSMVKQFSNNALDNVFNFIFRWVDFGKMMLEAMIAFLSIWQAFFAIFYNIFMYFYYLILFFIDRGSEESIKPRIFRRQISGRLSSTPTLDLKTMTVPPPGMASTAARAVAETAVSAASSISAPQKSAGGGQKRNILKAIGEPIVAFLLMLAGNVKKIGILINEFFTKKFKPVKEDEDTKSGKGSLIDEYLREYERQRK